MARRTEARRVAYTDTSAFIAFLDRSDSYHALFRRLFSEPRPLVTSSLVVAELHGWFLRRYDARRAIDALRFIEALSPLVIVAFDADALDSSAVIVKKFQDQQLTLADAHGLTILKAHRIAECWSTDRHLGLTGVSLAI